VSGEGQIEQIWPTAAIFVHRISFDAIVLLLLPLDVPSLLASCQLRSPSPSRAFPSQGLLSRRHTNLDGIPLVLTASPSSKACADRQISSPRNPLHFHRVLALGTIFSTHRRQINRSSLFWAAVAVSSRSTTQRFDPSHWTEASPTIHSSNVDAFFTVAPCRLAAAAAAAPPRFAPRLPLQKESESFSKRRLTSCTGRLLEHAGLPKRHRTVRRATGTPGHLLPRARIASWCPRCHINILTPSGALEAGSKIPLRVAALQLHGGADFLRAAPPFLLPLLFGFRWLGPFNCNLNQQLHHRHTSRHRRPIPPASTPTPRLHDFPDDLAWQ
jgi:hypothetical protein